MSTVVIATFGSLDEAHLLASRLASAGIASAVRDENTLSVNFGYALAIGGVKVAVAEEDEEDALALIAAGPADGPASESGGDAPTKA